MTFKDAQQFAMPFGKYRGQTLDKIAETNAGLLYLDWLYGERVKQRDLGWAGPLDRVSAALHAYLTDPGIASDLRKAVGDDED